MKITRIKGASALASALLIVAGCASHRTPEERAVYFLNRCGHSDYVTAESLLKRNPELVRYRWEYSGRTLLHDGADFLDIESLSLLMKYGADLNAINKWGQTPLDVAIAARNANAVRFLTTAGAKRGTLIREPDPGALINWLKKNPDIKVIDKRQK